MMVVSWSGVSRSINNYSDFYPFGMKIGYQTDGKYRYGYQGEFAEDETDETGFNSFEARMYDPVIGRWMSIDPARQYASGYVGMGNNPISTIDRDGRKGDNVIITDDAGHSMTLIDGNKEDIHLKVKGDVFGKDRVQDIRGIIRSANIHKDISLLTPEYIEANSALGRLVTQALPVIFPGMLASNSYKDRIISYPADYTIETKDGEVPVFYIFEDFYDKIYENHLQGFKKGAPPLLHYKSSGWGRDWFSSSSLSGYEVDEFPYDKTYEGGPGGIVSLMLVPKSQNKSHGAHWRQFIRRNLKGNEGSQFFVVTIPKFKK